MPRIYRVMKPETEEKPAVGRSATSLGVRIPQDIQPDENGLVEPGQGGMSVSPSLQDLPDFLVPERLEYLVPGASGRDKHRVWRMGEGDFTASAVSADLSLRPDKPGHGLVEPASRMTLTEYENALAATQKQWLVDETGG